MGSKHFENMNALRLWPRSFICLSVFGTPNETRALFFDILQNGVASKENSNEKCCKNTAKVNGQVLSSEHTCELQNLLE